MATNHSDHLLHSSSQSTSNNNYSAITSTHSGNNNNTKNDNRSNDNGMSVSSNESGPRKSPPPSPWLRKPKNYKSVSHPHESSELDDSKGGDGSGSNRKQHRHLTLLDLISIGLGATLGSGIFVLCGMIAHDYAGPATFLSWAIAGLAACCSGICYAELAGTFPSAGSSYAYAYVSMGELPAVLAAGCLTLEFTFSASAVARSWGDKITVYILHNHTPNTETDGWLLQFLLNPGWANMNPFAFLVSSASVMLLLYGVQESKTITNIFTLLKIMLVLFMSFGSLYYFEKENWTPFMPFQASGILRGATSSFFGYIGFDEICCVAGEAINPAVNLPKAVIYTLIIVTILNMLAAIGLTGLLPYTLISDTSAFPDGFRLRGIEWASSISALGEIITLPLVVWVTMMAQPRLQYAMAMDGLLPSIFSRADQHGNLYHGTLIAGIIMILIATFVPFTYLDDLISAGILVAFSMTDTSVILLRLANPDSYPHLLEKLVVSFNILSLAFGLLLSKKSWLINLMGFSTDDGNTTAAEICIQMICVGIGTSLVYIAIQISKRCPTSLVGITNHHSYFQTPMVPYLPLLGVWINWYLVAQLEATGLLLLIFYLGCTVVFYFCYGARHSVGNTRGWGAIDKRGIVPSISTGLLTAYDMDIEQNERDMYYNNQYRNDENTTNVYDNDGDDEFIFRPLEHMVSLPRVHHLQKKKISVFNHLGAYDHLHMPISSSHHADDNGNDVDNQVDEKPSYHSLN